MKNILAFFLVIMSSFSVFGQTPANILYDDNVTNSMTVLEWDNLDSLKAYTPTGSRAYKLSVFNDSLYAFMGGKWTFINGVSGDTLELSHSYYTDIGGYVVDGRDDDPTLAFW